MKVSLTNTGKRFNREWIFRHFSYEFHLGQSYAITGPNGSGKSTLLQAIAGALMISEGEIYWSSADHSNIAPEDVFKKIALAAPYLELIEEMTASELLDFHQQFKPLLQNIPIPEILQQVGLEAAAQKQIRYFSSGMKQRLKLAQAFFSDVPFLLLDEPCTNLDNAGIEIYHNLMNTYSKQRLIIVSSNDLNEYGFCNEVIHIADFK